MTATSPTHPALDTAPATLGRLLLAAGDRHRGTAMRVPRDGAFHETTFAELGRAAREIAAGLIATGVRPGDRVAILGSTRPEWTLADCGALCAGATVVPVYHTNSAEECRYVLAHSEAVVLICEDEAQLRKVAAVRNELPKLRDVYTMQPVPDRPSLDDLRLRGAAVDAAAVADAVASVSPGDAATIVYTSGTTGPPKGCVLTHDNCVATMRMYEASLEGELVPGAVIFMFLPLAHVLARVIQLVAIDAGATLSFWRGDPKRLLDDLAEARPEYFPSVPRLFEKVHARALATAEDASWLKRTIFELAIAAGARVRSIERRGKTPPPLLRAGRHLADRLVLERVRELFGGELRLGLTGAAPLGREVLEFFDACGVRILEGYGMTETCAAATLNTPGAHRFGTVGRPLPGSEVTIAADGEILMRGPHVFGGYHRDPGATDEAFADGWLCSGDLGEVDADGFLRITGRKKDLIITSSGKNVSPSNLETALRETRWVSQAVVYGDNRPYLVALLTLDPDELGALADEAGVAADLTTMAADPRVHEVLEQSVNEVNDRFARIEQIKRFAVLDHDLTQEAGELTPTLKVKRAVVNDRYGPRFAELYDD
jgi:long-chain acyl-CoA synthetase